MFDKVTTDKDIDLKYQIVRIKNSRLNLDLKGTHYQMITANVETMWHLVVGLRLLGVPAKQVADLLHIDIKTVYEWQHRVISSEKTDHLGSDKRVEWSEIIAHQLRKRRVEDPVINKWFIPTLPPKEIIVSKEQFRHIQLLDNWFRTIITESYLSKSESSVRFIWVQPISAKLLRRYSHSAKAPQPMWMTFHKKITFESPSDIAFLTGLNYWLASIGISEHFRRTSTLLKHTNQKERFKLNKLDLLRNINPDEISNQVHNHIGKASPLDLKRSLLRERRKSRIAFLSDLSAMPLFEKHGFIYVLEYPISKIPNNMLYPFATQDRNNRTSFIYPRDFESKIKDWYGDIELLYMEGKGYDSPETLNLLKSPWEKLISQKW